MHNFKKFGTKINKNLLLYNRREIKQNIHTFSCYPTGRHKYADERVMSSLSPSYAIPLVQKTLERKSTAIVSGNGTARVHGKGEFVLGLVLVPSKELSRQAAANIKVREYGLRVLPLKFSIDSACSDEHTIRNPLEVIECGLEKQQWDLTMLYQF